MVSKHIKHKKDVKLIKETKLHLYFVINKTLCRFYKCPINPLKKFYAPQLIKRKYVLEELNLTSDELDLIVYGRILLRRQIYKKKIPFKLFEKY